MHAEPFSKSTLCRAWTRRTVLASGGTGGMLAAGFLPVLAFAQEAYAGRPVTLMVLYPAGGANAAVVRLVGQKLTKTLDQ